jgi:hypothetical protein
MKTEVLKYIKENPRKSADEVYLVFRSRIKGELTRDDIRAIYNAYHRSSPLPIPIEQELELDHSNLREKKEQRTLKQKYDRALSEIEHMRNVISVALDLKSNQQPFEIVPYTSGGKGEATAVAVASDWHIEEDIKPETCGGMNFYNLEESKRRAETFFRKLLYLIQLEQKNTRVNRLILALLGDFISGDIGHKDILLSTLLDPAHAQQRCQDYLISGIEFLLANSELEIIVPCHSGNHARMEKEQMIAHEAGYSLEYIMYNTLKLYFQAKGEKRVKFIIPEGYHSYISVYDLTIRFHHGHSIRYGGGVGGITIPVNKAISQWNKTKDARNAPFYESVRESIADWNLARPADIDVFGHFHQFMDGGNFIANGSMIGYSPYAINVKGGYEPPKQALFFVHSKYGHYDTRRILFT